MEKTKYNIKHEALIRSYFQDVLEAGRDYKDGDKITQKEVFHHAERYALNDDGTYTKVILNRELIVDLYNDLIEIEKNVIEGKYNELPF